ncbi:Type II/IV secretion system protein TadC, associated with Flp pilus assembly [Alloactinosynnema sp. L-07]|uniref:type II secretion system F family protein n=1 Tax=Alloactinosynnema sp. L-07 TaxID=1653480 RepID=UPI00065EF4BC|nr:type II secretion system F family protein [Alloactinosynnema sp. L-07]CRK57642.1 Type II/IV secretion system protein TadC, associated with Flp pilus assembly [Alloactinosynnema sp. L-07]
MISIVLLGAGFGAGLWVLAAWAFPPRPRLAALLAQGTGPTADATSRLAAVMRGTGVPSRQLTRDLTLLGRSIDRHLTYKITFAGSGLLTPWLLQFLLAVADVEIAVVSTTAASVVLAAIGLLVPDVRVRSTARAHRAETRHALSAYLDLVWITLAGGAGVETALNDASVIGRGTTFSRIRRALDSARLTRTSPWDTLRRLGDDLDVAELTELAASLSLAGTEGARVRQSLAAKAAAMRTRQTSDAEADSQSATERMSLPVVALLLGFLVFIGYPAISQVLNTF